MMRSACMLVLVVLLSARLGAQVILPLLADGEPVAQVHHAFEDQRDGTVWLATKGGLFYTSDGSRLSERAAKDGQRRQLRYIESVGNELWVGGEGGVYRIGRGYYYENIDTNLPEGLIVYSILTENIGGREQVWLGTNKGIFEGRADGELALKLPEGSTFLGFADQGRRFTQEGGEPEERTLWASNRDGLFTFNRGTGQFEEFTGHKIVNVSKVLRDRNGQIYLWGNDGGGASLYEHPSGARIGFQSTGLLDVDILGGLLWYSVDHMVYSYGPTGAHEKALCDQDIKAVKTIEESQKYIWLIHRYGILLYSENEFVRCKELATSTADGWDLTSILETDNMGLLLYGPDGVYRFREEIEINLEIAKRSFAVVNRYSIDNYGYYDTTDCAAGTKGCSKWQPPNGITERFSAIIATSDDALEGKLTDPSNQFRSAGKWSRWGYHEAFYVQFQDFYGNSRRIAKPEAALVASYNVAWLIVFVVYTIVPTLVVFSLSWKIPLRLRNLLYSLSASALAPNPLRSLFLLMTRSMRRRLRDIYVDSWLARNGGPAVAPDESLMNSIETSNEILLKPEPEEDARSKFNDVASEICRRKGDKSLRDAIPIVCDLRNFDIKSSLDVEKAMLSHIKDGLDKSLWFSFIHEGFRSKLLDKADFVFLFYYDGSKGVRRAASDFARRDDSRRRLVLGTVSDQEEAQEPATAGRGPDTVQVDRGAATEPPKAAAAAEPPEPEPAPEPPPTTPPEQA